MKTFLMMTLLLCSSNARANMLTNLEACMKSSGGQPVLVQSSESNAQLGFFIHCNGEPAKNLYEDARNLGLPSWRIRTTRGYFLGKTGTGNSPFSMRTPRSIG